MGLMIQNKELDAVWFKYPKGSDMACGPPVELPCYITLSEVEWNIENNLHNSRKPNYPDMAMGITNSKPHST